MGRRIDLLRYAALTGLLLAAGCRPQPSTAPPAAAAGSLRPVGWITRVGGKGAVFIDRGPPVASKAQPGPREHLVGVPWKEGEADRLYPGDLVIVGRDSTATVVSLDSSWHLDKQQIRELQEYETLRVPEPAHKTKGGQNQ